MAIISIRDMYPATLTGDGSGFGRRYYNQVSTSTITGTTQVQTLGLPRHTFRLVVPDCDPVRGGKLRAVIQQARGGVNLIEAYDPSRMFSAGTATGDRTGSGAKGALAVSVSGGGMLRAGDWIQIGSSVGASQMVMVTADTNLPASVPIADPLFFAFSGARVRVDLPCTYFRLTGTLDTVGGVAGTRQNIHGFSADFLEAFS